MFLHSQVVAAVSRYYALGKSIAVVDGDGCGYVEDARVLSIKRVGGGGAAERHLKAAAVLA